MSFFENAQKFLNVAMDMANNAQEKIMKAEDYKADYEYLNDEALFQELSKEKNNIKVMAIKMLLADRGYEYSYEKGCWVDGVDFESFKSQELMEILKDEKDSRRSNKIKLILKKRGYDYDEEFEIWVRLRF